MYFLSDINAIEFRKFGSKDKIKRKSSLLKQAALVSLGGVGLIGAGYLANKGFKSLGKVKNISNNVSSPRVVTPTVNVTERKGIVSGVSATNNSDLNDINKVRKNLNNPDYIWTFNQNNSNQALFGRGKDKRQRAKRMGRFGAKARIGAVATVGGLLGGTGGAVMGGIPGAIMGGTLGALGAGRLSYLEHKNNAYSPIGKKNWKNYKRPPRMYGIPTDRLDLIGER